MTVGDRIQIVDLSRKRERRRVSGDSRVDFLRGHWRNNIRRLTVGESNDATFLSAKGQMHGERQVICPAVTGTSRTAERIFSLDD